MGFTVHFSPESGSKELRARPLAAQAEAGNVDIVKATWNGDFFDEIGEFPVSKFDDQADAVSRGFVYLIPKRGSDIIVAPQLIEGRIYG